MPLKTTALITGMLRAIPALKTVDDLWLVKYCMYTVLTALVFKIQRKSKPQEKQSSSEKVQFEQK